MSLRAGGGLTVMAVTFAVGPTVTRADIPVLCAGLAELLRGRAGGVVICEVAGVTRPDVATVEALARLRLTARRHGWRLAVGGAGPGLLRLIRLLGLADLLPQAGGQAEQREQPIGVEEVGDGRDAPR
jgi:hypothetical protein